MIETKKSAIVVYKITEKNCNGVLSRLYQRRDTISKRIDRMMSIDLPFQELEQEYNKIVDDIEEICEWRKTHNCLLEGDKGFSFY